MMLWRNTLMSLPYYREIAMVDSKKAEKSMEGIIQDLGVSTIPVSLPV